MNVNYLVRILYFTEEGKNTFLKLKAGMNNFFFEVRNEKIPLKTFVKDSFDNHVPLIFFGATGIAVRSIAPFVEDKLSDIPVIVIDEKGINVIPILSGHYGMANDLARKLARCLNANPVITTATDIENVFAIDYFAARNGFRILDKSKIKGVSRKLLLNERVFYKNEIEGLEFIDSEPENIEKAKGFTRPDIIFTNDDKYNSDALILVPKKLVIGMGCKRQKSFEELLEFLLEDYTLEELRADLKAICSIDKKADEMGLLKLAAFLNTWFVTYTKEELEKVKGDFSDSDFVRESVGVGNVSERAVVSANATLITEKIAKNGMTKAYGIIKSRRIRWQEKYI